MDYCKDLTKDMPIVEGPESDELIFPLSQHLGNPAKLIVNVGDRVKVGQLIAQANGNISSNIHSSVSGKVIKISSFAHPLGEDKESVFIENDRLYEISETVKPNNNIDINKISIDEIRKIIFDAGIVGLGGAAFPTHIKLTPPKDKKIDTIILNAAECEPYLTCDERVLREETKDVLLGLKLAAKASGAGQIYIAIEDNKPEAVEILKNGCNEYLKEAKIKVLKTKYPMGAEKILVEKVLKKKVPPIGLPLDIGVVVINVGTLAQIYKTFVNGMPLISRVATLSGQMMKNKGNFRIKLGTPVKAFLKDENQEEINNLKIILGGPMMGFAQYTIDIPIIKGTSGVLLLKDRIEEEKSCVRCATCVDKCPVDLLPLVIAEDVVPKVQECMECGLCSYFCPSKIPLVQKIKINKLKYLESKRKAV